MIIDSTSFHSQRYSGLKDKLYGYPSHRLFKQEIQAYHFAYEETEAPRGEGTCLPCHMVRDRVEIGILIFLPGGDSELAAQFRRKYFLHQVEKVS